jgi:hypothetical protein
MNNELPTRDRRLHRTARHCRWIGAVAWVLMATLADAAAPDDFPRFVVPGKTTEMNSLRELFWLHYASAGPQIALWDEWLPNATLWPALGTSAPLDDMQRRWAKALAGREMDAEGYVASQQHDGPAHAAGWPFPTWMQAGGIGWHFRPIGVAGYEAPPASTDGFQLGGATDKGINDRGWQIEITDRAATLRTPAFAVEARRAPWLRINWWAAGLEHAKCYIEWTTQASPEFSSERRVYFNPPPTADFGRPRETRTMVAMYRQPGWQGMLTNLRIGIENADRGQVVIKSLHTACDTRHNVNNLNFIRGCHDYFLWTRDVAFLRGQIERIRRAMRYVEREFQTREKKCIYTTWPGHEGRSGVRLIDGQKRVIPGEGIGSNYWDLLPFGGEDALATVYYYDTLLKLADLEQLITAHPDWHVPGDDAYDPRDLRDFAREVKTYFGKRFWNEATGRFGTVDLDGQLHDYGFTFLNNEAVAFDVATPEQANAIHSWLSGTRTVAGDTSTGDDIYHWRFAARSTARRNLDYYFWGWSNPESVPWGYQVQDGGAVLGWSYYDLMARLKTAGPDDAAARLLAIAKWFDETQREGGYRAYYGKDHTRGTLQGANVAGGLGLDHEFIESVLATQVMLYGFMGFRPTFDGFDIAPQLPRDWPELTVTRIHLHDQVLDITADRTGGLKIKGVGPGAEALIIHAPANIRLLSVEGVTARIAPAR